MVPVLPLGIDVFPWLNKLHKTYVSIHIDFIYNSVLYHGNVLLFPRLGNAT